MAVNGWWGSLAQLTVTVQWEGVGKCFYFSSAMFRFSHFRTVGVFTLGTGVMTKRSDWRFRPSTKQKKKKKKKKALQWHKSGKRWSLCVRLPRCIRSDSALLYVGVWILAAGWSTMMERWRSLLCQVSAVPLLLSRGCCFIKASVLLKS